MQKLQALIFAEGVPDVGGGSNSLRAITWKLALGYLPHDHAQWDAHLDSQRKLYHQWIQELTVDPNALAASAGGADSAEGSEAVEGGEGGEGGVTGVLTEVEDPLGVDHPLSTDQQSVWREWHVDEELRQEIRKDVDRHP